MERGLLPKIESTIFVPLGPLQATWYDRLLRAAVGEGVGQLLDRSKLLSLWTQLRKVCNGGPRQILATFDRQTFLAQRALKVIFLLAASVYAPVLMSLSPLGFATAISI